MSHGHYVEDVYVCHICLYILYSIKPYVALDFDEWPRSCPERIGNIVCWFYSHSYDKMFNFNQWYRVLPHDFTWKVVFLLKCELFHFSYAYYNECSFILLTRTSVPVRLFVKSFVHTFNHSYVHMFVRSFVHLFVRSFVRQCSFMSVFIYLPLVVT